MQRVWFALSSVWLLLLAACTSSFAAPMLPVNLLSTQGEAIRVQYGFIGVE